MSFQILRTLGIVAGVLSCGSTFATLFNYPAAESLARTAVIQSLIHNKVRGSDPAVLNCLRIPIASITVTKVQLGKFSDEKLERWADYSVELEAKNSEGDAINCAGIVNVEKSNVFKAEWRVNSNEKTGTLDCSPGK